MSNHDDYYKTLEVSKEASNEEIQKAYRRLARKHHPDLNQNDQDGARQRFQKVQEAFDVVGNPEKRKVYDQFGVSPDEIGAGGGRGPSGWSFGGGQGPFRSAGPGNINLDDILNMFRGGGGVGMGGSGPMDDDFYGMGASGMGGTRRPSRGADVERNLTIPFTMSIQGGSVELKIRRDNGIDESVSVKIPAGIADGKKIRLAGLGSPGRGGGNAGNLMITIHIENHPFFSREGDNLYVEIPVTLREAVFGGKIAIPTPKGEATVSIPPGSSSGTKLRIRGCGVPLSEKRSDAAFGDLFAELSVVLPKNWSSEDLELLKKIKTEPSDPVRKDLRWS